MAAPPPGPVPKTAHSTQRAEESKVLSEWHTLLQSHPDKQFVHYILTGIEKGFRIGFSDTGVTCHAAERNLLSASSNPEIVSKYLAEEVTLG